MEDNIKDLVSRLPKVNRDVTGFIVINIPIIVPYEDIGDLKLEEFHYKTKEGQAVTVPTLNLGLNTKEIQFSCNSQEMAEQFAKVLNYCKKTFKKQTFKVVKPASNNIIRFTRDGR